jgi:hypothetical protein
MKCKHCALTIYVCATIREFCAYGGWRHAETHDHQCVPLPHVEHYTYAEPETKQ